MLPVILDETDTRFYVDQSTVPGAGRGLFARASLRAGERLAVIGVRLRRDSLSDRCTSYADEYKIRTGEFVIIPCGLAAMANHSPHPNMVKVVEGQELFLQLLEDVEAGDELCFRYSDYARERWAI